MQIQDEDAEELVQDVLLKVHSKVGMFSNDGRAKLTTWIFHIAQNCAIDFLRAPREKYDKMPENFEPVPWHRHFAGRNSDLLAWLADELAEISAENQQILLWRAQDFSFAEIGGWLGLKEATARVRHFRSKKKLEMAGNRSSFFKVETGHNFPEIEVEHD